MTVGRTAWVALCLLVVCEAAGAEAPALSEPVAVPHAGISLAVPQPFALQCLHQPQEVLRAIQTEKGKPVHALVLSAFAVGPKDTLDAFAEKLLAEARASLAVRQLKVRKKSAIVVAGQPGTARRLTYTYRGTETTAAWVFWIRPVAKSPVRIGYVLAMECALSHQDQLLPALGAVIKSAKHVPVVPAVTAPVRRFLPAWTDSKRGYSLRCPVGWYGAQTDVGVQMALTDYLAAGEPTVTATVTVTPPDPKGAAAAACADRAIAQAAKAAAAHGRVTTVVSRTSQQLGGVGGVQFVLQQKPKAATGAGRSVHIVHRMTCCRLKTSPAMQCYSLIVVCQGGTAKQAAVLMDALASGFAFTSPPVPALPAKPTTRPAKPAAAGSKADK